MKLFTKKYTLTKHEKMHTRVIITIYGGYNIVGDRIIDFNILLTVITAKSTNKIVLKGCYFFFVVE